MTFAVAPVKDGKLHLSPSQKKRIATFMQKNEGNHVRVAFSQPTKTRSGAQNRYMWGCVYEILASETGHTTEEIHSFCKEMFLPKSYVTLAGHEKELPKSTTELSTLELEKYLERVRAFAASDLGIAIPLPNESL